MIPLPHDFQNQSAHLLLIHSHRGSSAVFKGLQIVHLS
jgi:hypothetical protein